MCDSSSVHTQLSNCVSIAMIVCRQTISMLLASVDMLAIVVLHERLKHHFYTTFCLVPLPEAMQRKQA